MGWWKWGKGKAALQPRIVRCMTSSNWVSWIALGLGFLSALVVFADIASGHRQNMKVMEWVWPITCLYAGPIGVWMYWTLGRKPMETGTKHEPAKRAA